MELAIIAIPFFAFLLVTMELSYDLFVQASLDNAVATAARQAQIGSKSGTAGETSAAYVKKSVCPALSGLLDCDALTVAVQPIPTNYDYYTAPTLTYAQAGSSGGSICTGTGGEVMQIAAWYAGPSFVGLLVPSFTTSLHGKLVHLAHSSAAYVNEYFSGGQTSGNGC